MTDKVRWIYNPETDKLDEVNPEPRHPVDFGKNNSHRIFWLSLWIVGVIWFIGYNKIIEVLNG